MRVRLPFLFNMPALAAWPLAFFTGIAVLLGLLLVFVETAFDFAVYTGALFGPVAFVPLIARWKGMSIIRWAVGVVVMALLQIVTQATPLSLFLHPITVLLAVVLHQPPGPKAAPDTAEPEAEEGPPQPEADATPRPPDLPALNRPRRAGPRRSTRRRRW